MFFFITNLQYRLIIIIIIIKVGLILCPAYEPPRHYRVNNKKQQQIAI